MKVVILAGGLGTRLAEETDIVPKPMVEIGGQPILWHIMKHYAVYGYHEFVVALGYKGEHIKQYFSDYYKLSGNLRVDLGKGIVDVDRSHNEDWIISLMDTGLDTQTGGRIKRLETVLAGEPFLFTYGDGISDVPIDQLVEFHKAQQATATITAVRPPARFGGLKLSDSKVAEFSEKAQIGEGWINGGFMVFEPDVLNYLDGDSSALETDALARLAKKGQLAAYRHNDFWQCMDTLRDKRLLQRLWQDGNPPWRSWA